MDYRQHKTLEFRRKFWKLFGAEITVTDPSSEMLVGLIRMKAWKLREDIRMYPNPESSEELLRIHARQIIDFGATYDVFEGVAQTPSFSLRRKGLRSAFVRDRWLILDGSEQQIGEIPETRGTLALARRYLGIIPYVGDIFDIAFAFTAQSYDIKNNSGQLLGAILHRKNPLVVKMHLTLGDAATETNPAIPVAATALLSVMDANKNN
jgi:hypothetical protein